MTTKKTTNPLIRQIADAKKSVKEWPTWMQEIAYFSTTSGSVGTAKSLETLPPEKQKMAAGGKKSR